MDSKETCARADELQHGDKWREAYDFLKEFEDTDDVELLWRLIRSYYRVGKFLAASTNERNEMAKKGQAAVEKGSRLFPEHFEIRKWSGVFISWSSELEGVKEKIKQSFVIKDHFLAAIKVNNKDATVKHLLGRWCYEVASVGWLTRQTAAAFFASPPNSSYDEALGYFEEAEETSPGWYTGNWLFLGKTYYQLGKKTEAKEYLTKLLEAKPCNPEDTEYAREATTLIKKV